MRYTALLLFILASVIITVGVLTVDPMILVERLRLLVEQSPGRALALFAILSCLSQLLVVPSGSLLLMAGGYLLGVLPAMFIYALLQIVTAVPVFQLGTNGHLRDLTQRAVLQHPSAQKALATLKEAPLSLALVLRLTPVIPSAIACLMAVASGIPFMTFLMATALVCWVRPLFFASIGAAAPALGNVMQPSVILDPMAAWPLLCALAAALLMLAGRLWVNRRTNTALAKRRSRPHARKE